MGCGNYLRVNGSRRVYVAAILDQYSRRIAGWTVSQEIDTAPVLMALSVALTRRQPPAGLIFHSNHGVQYASADYRRALAAAGLVASMSRKANCYDNATLEAFWSTLQRELIYRRPFEDASQRRQALFDYLEGFHNRQHRHSALGYRSPASSERCLKAPTIDPVHEPAKFSSSS